MVPYMNLSDSKSPKICRTLLSILADLKNVDVRRSLFVQLFPVFNWYHLNFHVLNFLFVL